MDFNESKGKATNNNGHSQNHKKRECYCDLLDRLNKEQLLTLLLCKLLHDNSHDGTEPLTTKVTRF